MVGNYIRIRSLQVLGLLGIQLKWRGYVRLQPRAGSRSQKLDRGDAASTLIGLYLVRLNVKEGVLHQCFRSFSGSSYKDESDCRSVH